MTQTFKETQKQQEIASWDKEKAHGIFHVSSEAAGKEEQPQKLMVHISDKGYASDFHYGPGAQSW